MTRQMAVLAAAFAACVAGTACSSNETKSPTVALDAVSKPIAAERVSLLAWKETLGSAYPLTISGHDTITALLKLIDPDNAGWKNGTVPGIPIIAEFYSGTDTLARYGFIATAHGQGGYFIKRDNQTMTARSVSADDLAHFLAFFGMGSVVVQ